MRGGRGLPPVFRRRTGRLPCPFRSFFCIRFPGSTGRRLPSASLGHWSGFSMVSSALQVPRLIFVFLPFSVSMWRWSLLLTALLRLFGGQLGFLLPYLLYVIFRAAIIARYERIQLGLQYGFLLLQLFQVHATDLKAVTTMIFVFAT